MNALINTFLLGLGAASFTPAASADVFQYQVKHVPVDETDCHAQARHLGREIESRTGVSLVRAVCTELTPYGATLLVEYRAAAPLNLVSTMAPLTGVDRGGSIFATLSSCRAALPDERARFKAATKLDPVIAFCSFDPFSEAPYAIRIDAFGHAEAAPQQLDWRVFGLPVGTSGEDIATAIRTGLQAHGLEPSYVSYKDAAFDGIWAAGIYASQVIASRQVDLGYTQTAEQCLAAVADAQSALVRTSDFLTAVCSYNRFLDRFPITLLTLGDLSFAATTAVETFSSHATCINNKGAVIGKYLHEFGRPVLGAVCSQTSNRSWSIILLELYAAN